MKTKTSRMYRYTLWFFLIPIFVLGIPDNGFAATTGTTALFRQVGSGSNVNVGDYISGTVANGGINQIYQFYLEVPPATTQIVVRLFDAEIGGTDNGGDRHDWLQGAAPYTTRCRYTLYRPNGTQQVTLRPAVAAAGYNNAWYTLATVANPAAGHWRLVADMSSANSAGGDDCNGWGFDVAGTGASGSREIKAYAYSFVPVGELDQTGNPTTTTLYPYITSGCEANWKDFDGDNPPGAGVCTITYRSRNGLVSGNYLGSASTVWFNRNIGSYQTDSRVAETGIWTWTGTYTRTAVGGGNFGVFYMGNFLNATTPPTTQPQANTFRNYLPSGTGAVPGGAPSKPIVTQQLSYISGSNPPVVASTTRVRVEIAVFNPTPWAITFSSSNLVTSNIPGSGVVYAGNATVSQGTVVSQPSIVPAGTGNITWNPGPVSAGATATLYYDVDVTPPSAARFPVTGIPTASSPGAIDGTWARYVDETGDATIGRQATYIYGPLCELAMTAGNPIPTWVAVSCFEACAEESQPTVEWHTASEVGAVGFYLWRQDRVTKEYELVNPNFLPALPNSPQGGVYRLADPGAFSGEPVVYRLEEIDSLGRTMSYGPFTVTFGVTALDWNADERVVKAGKEEPTDIYGYWRFDRERTALEQERLMARKEEQQRGVLMASSQSKERARITVKGRGLFYVTAAQIARSLGITESAAAALVSGYNLNLTSMGKNIALLADAAGAGIFFYSEGKETAFSDRSVFWLERGNGLAMETVGSGNAGAAAADQSYKETLHFEENHYALTTLFSNPQGDFWLWDYVVAGSGAKSFPVHVPGVALSGTATLTVTLQGETDTQAKNDHHAIVALNGTRVGEATWDGTEAHSFEISFNASLLNEGANTITVSGSLDMGAPYSIFYVESLDLSYQRYYKAVDNRLICRGGNNSVVSVSGFSEYQVVALDVSNPVQPKLLTGIAPDASGRVTFIPRSGAADHLLSGLNAALRPLAVVGDRPAQLKGGSHSAEYIVIAPEEFKATAQELADYRQGKGLKSLVVTLEDIYDAFNFGVPSPLAVRDFLAHAYAKWGGKKVKYAVLAGKGTYDYKDYLGFGDNLVPVILAKTPEGFFAADKTFGDVTGKNGLPEIAVGRLPVVTSAELRIMIDKIRAYESGQGPWTGKALWIADNSDDGGDFAAGCNGLAALTAGYQAVKIYLGASAQETRDLILSAWNAGAGLVNYCGHGGLNQLAQENLFSLADARALRNGGQLPLAVMLTCVAGRFELPGFTCLSEALILNQGGGMAGGLMPAGAALHADSMRLAEEFYKAVFRGREASAGTALVAAMKSYLQLGGKASLLNVYNWLGDPALAFK